MDAHPSPHLTVETLESYGLGTLDDARAEDVARHLEDCHACRRHVAEAAPDSFLGRLRDAQIRLETSASAEGNPPHGPQMDPERTAVNPAAGPEPSASDPGAAAVPTVGVPSRPSGPRPERAVADEPTVDPVATGESPMVSDDTQLGVEDRSTDVSLQPGTRIGYFGDYELLKVLGEGGMGIVYKARQLSLNRPVALKMIRAARFPSADEVRRFQNEAEAVARLDHPNIVPIFEVGRYEDQHYFSMKLVGGESLDKRLKDYVADPRRAARLVAMIADAIHHAHQRGILHRDLKPANILVDPEGQPHVTDFGLAKRVEGDSELTQSGAILGTPAYMAPEQASGKRGVVTTSTDVYGLGTILYAMLTGRAPFAGTTPLETLDQAREQAPELPRRLNPLVPLDIEVICLKCLEKDPRRRYASADALAEDLRRWLTGEPIAARPVGNPARLWMWCRRNPWIAGAAGVTAASLVILAVVSLLYADQRAKAASNIATLAQHLELEGENLKRERSNLKDALAQSNRRLAMLNWERGQAACDQGQIGLGLLWMVESVRVATDAGDPVWKNLALTSLSAWQRHHTGLKGVYGDGLDEISAAALSPDGKTIFAGDSSEWNLLDAATGRPIVGSGPDGWGVTAVAFSPDGKSILTGSMEGTVQLWDAATGEPIGKPLKHQHVDAVAFSPDGKSILTGGNKMAQLWDAATGQPIGKPLEHRGRLTAAAFSPDGKSILTGTMIRSRESGRDDGSARLWDAATGQPMGKPLEHRGAVTVVAFSRDGKSILTGGDKMAQLWDAATGQPMGKPLEHQGAVMAMAFSRDGKSILTGTVVASSRSGRMDGSARLWDTATGRPLAIILEHRGGVYGVAFSLDGRSILTRSSDGMARLWDATTVAHSRELLEFQDSSSALAFSPDGKSILTGGDKTARLWDANTGQPIGKPLEHRSAVTAVAFNLDGKSILTGGDKMARLWDAATGQPIGKALEHRGAVTAVAFSPDGKSILTGTVVNSAETGRVDGSARLWDAATGQPIGKPMEHRGAVTAVAFSPDAKSILTGGGDLTSGGDKLARLWDAATGQPIGGPLEHRGAVTAVAFSPDGKSILTGSDDHTARLWDTATSQPIGGPLEHRGAVTAVAFSPDAKSILTGSDDHTARLWDTATGQPLGPPLRVTTGDDFDDSLLIGAVMRSLGGQFVPKRVYVAFSPDGKFILTGSEDCSVRLWEAPAQLPADLSRLAAWVETMTGLELDEHGFVHALDSVAWRQRRDRLVQLGGPPLTDIGGRTNEDRGNDPSR